MDSIQDLLNQKAAQMDLYAKKGALQLLQEELDRYYDGHVKLKMVRRDGTAVLTTRNASLASTVRYDQVRLIASMQTVYTQDKGIVKLQIIIG